MSLRDEGARVRSLANDLGPTRGANSPDAYKVALTVLGVEINNTDCPGYMRADLDADDFADSDLGMSATVTFADPTDEWTQEPDGWQLLDAADTTEGWDNGEIPDGPLVITGAGDGPELVLTVFYAESLDA